MKKEVTLNWHQAKELKWFCNNVTSLHTEYYKLHDMFNAFDTKFKRLEKTCDMIEKFFAEHEVKPPALPNDDVTTLKGEL